MRRDAAQINALATLTYCMTYYPEYIIDFQHFKWNVEISIHFPTPECDPVREWERLQNIVLAGVSHYFNEMPGKNSSVLHICWEMDITEEE